MRLGRELIIRNWSRTGEVARRRHAGYTHGVVIDSRSRRRPQPHKDSVIAFERDGNSSSRGDELPAARHGMYLAGTASVSLSRRS